MKSPYPIYDRSGVEDDPAPLAAVSRPAPVPAPPARPPPSATLRRPACVVLAAVGGAVLGALALLLALARAWPQLATPGLLALGFGLRHGVDADHIAAIDNVARQLAAAHAARGEPPPPSLLLVGTWFALGHSSVVFALCGLVALGRARSASTLDALAGGASARVGALVSGATLLVLGAINARAARAAWRKPDDVTVAVGLVT